MSKIKVHDQLVLKSGTDEITKIDGSLVATKFYGDGSQLTNLPASSALETTTIPAQNAIHEGGELLLEGAGTWNNAIVDLYKDRFRIHLGPSADVKFNVGADGQLGIGPGFWDEADHTVHAKAVTMPEIVSHETTSGEKTRMTSFAGEGFVGTLGTGTLHVHSGNTFAMNIFNSGEVQMPFQPAFEMVRTTDKTFVNNWTITYDTTTFDRGNNTNTSTGLFTAPVEGAYMFYVWATFDNGSGTDDSIGNGFVVNGSTSIPTNSTTRINPNKVTSPGVEHTYSWTRILYLQANDTVGYKFIDWDNSTSIIDAYFGGHLIG